MRDEWPLAGFTIIVPVLVALLTAAALGGYRPSAVPYMMLTVLAAVLSLAHLGKRTRAWRAVSNPRTSWLSREVLLFVVLAGYGTLLLGREQIGWVFGVFTVAVGFATLVVVDLVYASLPHVNSRPLLSAGVVLTACFLISIFLLIPLTASLLGALKLVLYLTRKHGFGGGRRSVRPALSLARVAFGFVLPGLLWILFGTSAIYYVVGAVLVGELIDRLEFYTELDIQSPARQMTLDLEDAVSVAQSASVSQPT